MPRRLQVILDEEEYREIQGVARRQGVTVAEWVRQALREARSNSAGAIDAKLRAVADASRHRFPTADIDTVLKEIEAGERSLSARTPSTPRSESLDACPGIERLE